MEKVYFLGIGGIGMSALARFYQAAGFEVYGYDLTPTALTDQLMQEGMRISFIDSLEAIPESIKEDPTIPVVYTPAIPDNHKGLNFFQENGYPLKKRAQALGELSRRYRCIAVSGTHGKTTTSAFAAHILHESKLSCISFVGGIMSGYESNILIDDNADFLLVEADEFDRSFLNLHPEFLGVTSVDADHLDIYKDLEDLQSAFKELLSRIPDRSNALVQEEVVKDGFNTYPSYGFSEDCDVRIVKKGVIDGFSRVEVLGLVKEAVLLDIPLPGDHNILNAVLAISLCLKAGCEIEQVQRSLAGFKGVKRRFEFLMREPTVFIDDYAHHPKEIDALISATRELFPDKKLVGIFQPHLFSRTQDFADEFARSLSALDQLVLLPIYPAREKPIPGVNAKMLLEKVQLNEKSIVNKENLPLLISSLNPEILLTIGAGDISHLLPTVKQALIAKN